MVMKEPYLRRNFDQGPQTYSDASFMDTIATATGVYDITPPATVIDLMSGPGKVAKGLRERVPGHHYIALDAVRGQLDKVEPGIDSILADVRTMGEQGEIADVVVARYGIKDIPKDQQPGVLTNIFQILKPGGVLVIADMVSPQGAQEWNNLQHSTKQQLGGRNIQEEGECHIPTEEEWLTLLRQAGFQPEVFSYYVSKVSTPDWVRGDQIKEGQREVMDRLLLEAPPDIKEKFRIRQEEDGVVKIDYPVLVIRAVKPEEPIQTDSGTEESSSAIPSERVVYQTQ